AALIGLAPLDRLARSEGSTVIFFGLTRILVSSTAVTAVDTSAPSPGRPAVVDREPIERTQRVRRHDRAEALDHVAVVVVMRRLDQDQLKAALRATAAWLIGMEAPVGAHYLSRRRRLLGRDARLSDSGAHSHIDADK